MLLLDINTRGMKAYVHPVLHEDRYTNIIQINPNLKTVLMFISAEHINRNVISIQHSIINKKEPTIDRFHNMDEPQKHYYKFKKPETIDYTYCLIPFL